MKWIKHLWAGAGSLFGLLLYGIAWAWARPIDIDRFNGILWIECKRLIPNWAGGQTWGEVVFHKGFEAHRIAHESTHVEQWRKWGPLFFLAYPVAAIVAIFKTVPIWYRLMSFEVEAYKAGEQARETDTH